MGCTLAMTPSRAMIAMPSSVTISACSSAPWQAPAQRLGAQDGGGALQPFEREGAAGVADDVEAGGYPRASSRDDVVGYLLGRQVLGAPGVGYIRIRVTQAGGVGAQGPVHRQVAADGEGADALCGLDAALGGELPPETGHQRTGLGP